MGLTKPRASQIYNLDYKQATRVVTVTDIAITGGAPSQVDGVSLSLGDRILVTGQSTASQNGLYLVATLGSGGNGTWIRTGDGNETGEIEAGMIIMVTEGVAYQDTQWKLITDNPIVIGTTPLTFTQNYSANSISGGTSNVTVFSNANVTISSAGTSNVLTISNTGAYVTGIISATGNIIGGNLSTSGSGGDITGSGNILTGGFVSATGNVSGNYILGNGALLTGVITSVANINNGTSNITVVSSGGNITVGINGTGNVAVFSTNGLDITGNVSTTGNVTGDYILGNGSQLTGLVTNSISDGNSNVVVNGTDGNVTIGINGVANTVEVSPGELTVYGVFSNPKNISSNVIIGPNINSMLIGPIAVDPTGNIFVPTGSTLNII
jgi:hypothetical protein